MIEVILWIIVLGALVVGMWMALDVDDEVDQARQRCRELLYLLEVAEREGQDDRRKVELARGLLDQGFWGWDGPNGELYDPQAVNQAHRVLASGVEPRPVKLELVQVDEEHPF